jgi:hypothetical protein
MGGPGARKRCDGQETEIGDMVEGFLADVVEPDSVWRARMETRHAEWIAGTGLEYKPIEWTMA